MKIARALLAFACATSLSHAEVECHTNGADDDEGIAALVNGLLVGVDSCASLYEVGGCDVLHKNAAETFCPRACGLCKGVCADTTLDKIFEELPVENCQEADEVGMCSSLPTLMGALCPVTCGLGCGAPKQVCVCGTRIERTAPIACEGNSTGAPTTMLPDASSDAPTEGPTEQTSDTPTFQPTKEPFQMETEGPTASPSESEPAETSTNDNSVSAQARAAMGVGNALVAALIASQARKELNNKKEKEIVESSEVKSEPKPRSMASKSVQVNIKEDKPHVSPYTLRKIPPAEIPSPPEHRRRQRKRQVGSPKERVGGGHLYESERLLVKAPARREPRRNETSTSPKWRAGTSRNSEQDPLQAASTESGVSRLMTFASTGAVSSGAATTKKTGFPELGASHQASTLGAGSSSGGSGNNIVSESLLEHTNAYKSVRLGEAKGSSQKDEDEEEGEDDDDDDDDDASYNDSEDDI